MKQSTKKPRKAPAKDPPTRHLPLYSGVYTNRTLEQRRKDRKL